ncbi:MAG: isochorismatase family protein [Actinomycetes bacterium]|jgi:nicotinamidase/pyrazinamidase|nr:MAG: isochorismatase [Actinomycetota bacterium]
MRYDNRTALVVVDVQNDFADPGGSLYVPGGEESIEFVNGQVTEARQAGAVIVYTQDWHPESTPHFAKDGGIWPVHCVGGTAGADFHPDLLVVEDAVFVKKGTGGEDGYSAFNVSDPETGEVTPTGLADRLREAGVEKVVVVGLALDYCVKASALDAASEGFATTVLADGTRAVNLAPGDGTRAAAELARAGVEIA